MYDFEKLWKRHMLARSGIEAVFKALRRMEKSGENDVVTLARLFEVSCKAGRHCFPNKAQQTVTADDWAATEL